MWEKIKGFVGKLLGKSSTVEDQSEPIVELPTISVQEPTIEQEQITLEYPKPEIKSAKEEKIPKEKPIAEKKALLSYRKQPTYRTVSIPKN